jgi:hypothetical protein
MNWKQLGLGASSGKRLRVERQRDQIRLRTYSYFHLVDSNSSCRHCLCSDRCRYTLHCD